MSTITAAIGDSRNVAGRVWAASDQARELLEANGLSDIADVFACGEPLDGIRATYGNRHAHRGVVRAKLHERGQTQVVYIKKQWRRDRWLPRWPDLKDGTTWMTMPEREWRGLALLRAIGLDTAEPLALFTAGRFSARTAIITQAAPPARDLLEMVENRELDTLSSTARQALAREMAMISNRIRDAGMSWRSLEPKHMFPRREPDGRWRIWLIDCEGVRTRATARQIADDRRKLLGVLHRLEVPQDFFDTLAEALGERQISRTLPFERAAIGKSTLIRTRRAA